jgi:hypothetical protein
LTFVDSTWEDSDVIRACRFSGMTLVLNGKEHAPEEFLGKEVKKDDDKVYDSSIVHLPEFGLKYRLAPAYAYTISVPGKPGYNTSDNGKTVINFHGQTIRTKLLDLEVLRSLGAVIAIDMTGEPTDLRMVLPARENLYDNETVKKLSEVLERNIYKSLVGKEHTLPFDVYERAQSLGFKLKESSTAYFASAGCWCDQDDDFTYDDVETAEPLTARHNEDIDGRNVDLLALQDAPLAELPLIAQTSPMFKFRPVSIRNGYAGYDWAKKTAQVQSTLLHYSTPLETAHVWQTTVSVVDRLEIVVNVSRGAAVTPYRYTTGAAYNEHGELILTKDFVFEEDFHRHLFVMCGGYDDDDANSWERQFECFEEDLDNLQNKLRGPHEGVRRSLQSAAKAVLKSATMAAEYESVTICKDGTAFIRFKDEDGNIVTSTVNPSV